MACAQAAASLDAGIIGPAAVRGRFAAPRVPRPSKRMNFSLVRGTMLKLRIVSDQGRSLAERSSATFSVQGGTIGRSADNDWVLPDPLRYVSAHHARVQFREGHFYLQDVSTNGVYVNDDMEPLATRGSGGYRLADGDVLRMGEYHIVAALEARPAQDEAGAAVPTSIHALHTLGRHEPDIGAPLDLDALLVPANQDGSSLPVKAYGQSVDSGRVRALNPKAHAERAPEVPLLDGAGVQWLREAVTEAKRPETATAQAMRAALVEFLGRLDPAELEARFERAARRGNARSADKAQYWELFATFYRNPIEMPADHLPHTFVEAFAAAYRESSKKPPS